MARYVTSQRESVASLVGRCDPAPAELWDTAGVREALDMVGAAIVISGPRERRGRSRRAWLRGPRRLLIVGAASLAAGAGVAAAAGLFVPTRTGVHQSGAAVRMGGPGELLNASGTDFRRIALQLSVEIPYPPGYQDWRRWVLPAEDLPPRACAAGEGGGACSVRVSTGALRGWFAMSAFSAWVIDWWHASRAGDTAAAARDARIIAQAPHWDAVRAEDPHPRASMRGDLGSTQSSLFGWMLPFVSAVRAGDISRVDQLLDSNLYGGMFAVFDPGWDKQLHREAHVSRPLSGYVSYLERSGQ
jgi:hypothetical protein